ncbi:LRR and NB-ARC domains-containing disease resistance protein [Euphorbia peplus]|nr:LRR and NB-ARC domains-containing disease resistance protein [Euphorbia peplus]
MDMSGQALLSAFVQVMINRMNSSKFLDSFNGQKPVDFDLLLKNLKAKMVSIRSVIDDAEEEKVTGAFGEAWLDKLNDAVYGADDLLEEVSCEALRCILQDEPKFQNSFEEKFEMLFKELEFTARQDEESSRVLDSSDDLCHLKLCSEYATILPHGNEFKKEDLILLWIGAGLVMETSEGEKYFQQLLSKNFFRQSSEYPVPLYSMTNQHSRSVPGDFCFNLETKVYGTDVNRIRHLSVTVDDAFQQLKHVYGAQSLQTFFALKSSNSQPSKYMNDGVLERLIQKFKRLRVLSLSGHEKITELSNSIGHLKYLRYLNVSRTAIKKLPEYVCSLYFLEILILYGCKGLIELPGSLGRLINLFHLDNRGTRLQRMPPQFGKLTKLQTLTDFVVGKESSCRISELGVLQHLQGELCVRNLQYVKDAEDAREAHLDGKSMLTKLELRWAGDAASSVEVLEELKPHVNLEHLGVSGYGGVTFPPWLGDSLFEKMVSLNLHGCKKCSSLPPVGQLSCLQELSIAEFHGIETVGLEFCGSFTARVEKPFASLKKLRFERMPNWEKWDSEAYIGAFRLLKELYIIDCPKLKETLPSFLPSLTTLETRECRLGFDSLLPNAPSVFKMGLKDGSGLLELHHLPSGMRYLKIDRISSLDFVLETMKKASGFCATIEVIHISTCNSKSFYLEDFPNLKRFHINSCPQIESLFTHEEVPEISSSTEIVEEHHQSKGKFPLIQELYVKDCPKLTKALPSNLPSLQVMHVSGCHSLKCFQFKLVPNLTRVDISGCTNLESLLGSSSVDSFPLLEKMCIRQCPKLIKALPSHLPCLETLESEGCQQIMGSSFPDLPAIRRVKLRAETCHVELDKSHVEIRNWDSLQCFPMDSFHVHELNEVAIISCESLEYLSRSKELGDFNFLTRMKIWGCPKLVSFPEGKFSAPKLTLLSLWKCTALKSLPEEMQSLFPSLQDLQLIDCPSLEILSEKSFPTELKSLKIQGCKMLSGGSKLKDFLAASHLSSFVFDMSADAESFPGDIQLPSTIKHLEIEGCLKVKSLDKELQDLISMETLIIGSCPLLESIDGLPSCLSTLSISNCPSLEDWFLHKNNRSKFAGVKCKKINYRNLDTWVLPSESEELRLPSCSSESISPSDSAINLQNGSSSSALLPSHF